MQIQTFSPLRILRVLSNTYLSPRRSKIQISPSGVKSFKRGYLLKRDLADVTFRRVSRSSMFYIKNNVILVSQLNVIFCFFCFFPSWLRLVLICLNLFTFLQSLFSKAWSSFPLRTYLYSTTSKTHMQIWVSIISQLKDSHTHTHTHTHKVHSSFIFYFSNSSSSDFSLETFPLTIIFFWNLFTRNNVTFPNWN